MTVIMAKSIIDAVKQIPSGWSVYKASKHGKMGWTLEIKKQSKIDLENNHEINH